MATILFNSSLLTVNTYSRRKYGNTFYSWATADYSGISYDMGDPYEAGTFPKFEAAIHVINKLSNGNQITIIEREFRQLFKGLKNGALLYANTHECLESKGINFE